MYVRLDAGRPLQTEAGNGSHRQLCGSQDLLPPIFVKHRMEQILSQLLFVPEVPCGP